MELEESVTVVNGDAWFWLMIRHANVREGAADHKPPLQRATQSNVGKARQGARK